MVGGNLCQGRGRMEWFWWGAGASARAGFLLQQYSPSTPMSPTAGEHLKVRDDREKNSGSLDSPRSVCVCMLSWVWLFDPHGYSPLGSSVHRIFQAKILEWVAISFPRVIFPTQRSNLCLSHLLHFRQMLSHCATTFCGTTVPSHLAREGHEMGWLK